MSRSPVPTSHAVTFEALRPKLLRVARRVLDDAAEADDVVQEAWVRWQRIDPAAVRDADAFLATVTRRLALNVAQSAQARREVAMSSCPVEPVDSGADPFVRAERGDIVASGLGLLSERLTPAERAAYVLREAFDYPYREISRVLGLSEANARQIVTRARAHLAREPGGQVCPVEQRALVEAFSAAARAGDLRRLERVLAGPVLALAG
jgi:RNA polymerase sigma-70 factor (ECF subfamily)